MSASDDEKKVQKLQLIKDTLKSYPDFPKEGINFYDVFSLLAAPVTCRALLELLEARVRQVCPSVDVFVGLDARGFLFGLPLAMAFSRPFVPIRKRGKLPGKTASVSYKLEYGEDVFEIQADSISKGQKVVILDDLLATGGTLAAANSLVSNLGAEVCLSLVCIELAFLEGRKKVASPVETILTL